MINFLYYKDKTAVKKESRIKSNPLEIILFIFCDLAYYIINGY